MGKNIVPGVIVSHISFGEGTVISVKNDIADVNFLNFGKKTVLITYLKVVDDGVTSIFCDKALEVSLKPTISFTDIVHFVIDTMNKNKTKKIKTNQCVRLVRERFGQKIEADFIVQAVSPIFDIVFLSHLIKREQKLISNKAANKTINNTLDIKDIGVKFEPVETINDFECACMKEKFDSALKLFYAREIIHFAQSIKKPDSINILYLKNLSESLLNVLLRQMSINYFYNDVNHKNPLFYAAIFNFIQDNELSESQKDESLKMIAYYLTRMIINQFLIVDGKRSQQIYLLDKNNNLLFSPEFIKLLNKEGESLDRRIVNRLKYFISKNNEQSSQLQHYIDSLGKDDSSSKDIILKFEYEENLKALSEELVDDIILKSDFKSLMKKHSIPVNETYFKMCMARIDYTLKSKRLILKNKYKTITSYYRTEALKNDVYRYSNPYNLDEYDLILKHLNLNLDLIDVGYGVYLTKTNMLKNGITDQVIEEFKQNVISIVRKTKFMSLTELMAFMKNDKVVQYCDGDKKQMIQFIRPIDEIGINELSSGSFILCMKNSKNYKGDFIEFIFGKSLSMDVYDIRDMVLEHFDVEYSKDEIVRDLKYTSLYYSEEMEKVYKNKQLFISEVFGDGN